MRLYPDVRAHARALGQSIGGITLYQVADNWPVIHLMVAATVLSLHFSMVLAYYMPPPQAWATFTFLIINITAYFYMSWLSEQICRELRRQGVKG